jgi:hypothetical protein
LNARKSNKIPSSVIRAAWDALTRFNLGCYACQMGQIKLAKEWVRQAIDFDPKFKMIALDDHDLEPLWESFKV